MNNGRMSRPGMAQGALRACHIAQPGFPANGLDGPFVPMRLS